jgi:hypothetical protein
LNEGILQHSANNGSEIMFGRYVALCWRKLVPALALRGANSVCAWWRVFDATISTCAREFVMQE